MYNIIHSLFYNKHLIIRSSLILSYWWKENVNCWHIPVYTKNQAKQKSIFQKLSQSTHCERKHILGLIHLWTNAILIMCDPDRTIYPEFVDWLYSNLFTIELKIAFASDWKNNSMHVNRIEDISEWWLTKFRKSLFRAQVITFKWFSQSMLFFTYWQFSWEQIYLPHFVPRKKHNFVSDRKEICNTFLIRQKGIIYHISI